jgi:hypothetical protein
MPQYPFDEYPQSELPSSITDAAGNRLTAPVGTAVTVATPASPRWVPAFPQLLGNNTVSNFDPGVSWSGAFFHTNVPICLDTTATAIIVWNSCTGVSIGESAAGASAPSDWKQQNRVIASVMVGGANQGRYAFTNAATTIMMDSLPRLSKRKALTLTTSSNVILRFGGYKFDTSMNFQVPSNILANRKVRLAGSNVTTDVPGEVDGTGNIGGSANNGYCPYFLLETTSTTFRSWIIKGSSIAYGGGGWWVTGVQGSYPQSTAMAGAASAIEIGLFRRADAANGMTSSVNLSEPGASMFRWTPQSALPAIKPDLDYYAGRFAFEQLVGATDVAISDGVNAYSAASSGFDLTNYIAAMSQMLETEIKKNQALNRRTWFCLECLQTTSSNWSVAQTDAQFRNAQTPALNGIGSGATANRAALKTALAAVCARLGSAWLIDMANIPVQPDGTTAQSLNSSGQLVYNKVYDGTTYYTPTGYTGAEDGTHPGHALAVIMGDYLATLFGTKNQTTFPAPGALN